jgi:hypothetical protein
MVRSDQSSDGRESCAVASITLVVPFQITEMSVM